MSEVVVIDFDGTIVEHAFPHIGEPLPLAFEVIKEIKEAGYKIILWTCREDDSQLVHNSYLTHAVEFCRQNGVEFDAVNESIPSEDFRPEGFTLRKPYAMFHIDDKNFGGFPGWHIVRKVLIEKHTLKVEWKTTES